MIIEKFAPVIIPTLNRYEHLERCVKSLANCKYADKTELIISLDYPPSSKYEEGWKRVCDYVNTITGFEKVTIFRHKTNLGAAGNLFYIHNYAKDHFDSYIFTEDDDEFSPNFLDYMNQNLILYKNDPTIFRIVGYLPFNYHFANEYSQFKANRHIAWGIGIWTDKDNVFTKYYLSDYLIRLASDEKVVNSFEKDRLESILFSLIKMAFGHPVLEDVIVASYLEMTNTRCVLPTKSLVRNHGWDGSGMHGGYTYGYKEQEIQTSRAYVMNEAPEEFTIQFEKVMHEQRRKRKRTANDWLSFFSWYLYKYTHIYCEFKFIHDFGKAIKNRIQCLKRTK